MTCCSSNNVETGSVQNAGGFSSQIDSSADRLGALLAQTPEYQEFIRLARLINLDPDVKRLSMEIRKHQMVMLYSDSQDTKMASLEEELEALPAVQAYRQSEAAVKSLFHAVDQLISAGAGVAFAPNAVQSGCG